MGCHLSAPQVLGSLAVWNQHGFAECEMRASQTFVLPSSAKAVKPQNNSKRLATTSNKMSWSLDSAPRVSSMVFKVSHSLMRLESTCSTVLRSSCSTWNRDQLSRELRFLPMSTIGMTLVEYLGVNQNWVPSPSQPCASSHNSDFG